MHLLRTHTQSLSDVVLHFGQALFHARLFPAQDGHIDRPQYQLLGFDEASAYFWKVVERAHPCFSCIGKPVVYVAGVGSSCERHHDGMRYDISITSLGVRTFREVLKGYSSEYER